MESKMPKVTLRSPFSVAKNLAIGAAIVGLIVGIQAGVKSMTRTDHSMLGGILLGLIGGVPLALAFAVVTFGIVWAIAKTIRTFRR